jgi:hypothetical protein
MRRIYTRKEWGARPARDVAHGNRPPREAFLHNSDDPDFAQFNTLAKQKTKMRQIQDFHMDTRGWSDFAYHFAVFQPAGSIRSARIFRGRESLDVIPAAQLNHNSHTLAIVVIGHGGKDPLKADTRRAIVEILNRYPGLQALGGHRDVVATECPGDRFYAHVPELARRADLRRV